ncbi:MAG: hypothetical protein ABIU63_14775 [Chitinophagaceae bacterium]
MKDFNAIKDMWQQQPGTANKDIDPVTMNKLRADAKTVLLRHQLIAAITLSATALFIIWIGFFSSIVFKLTITYLALLLLIAVILLQVAVIVYTYKKLQKIDDTLPPAAHLKQWESYYGFRKKQIQWNKPLYFIFLNLAMGIYFIEMLRGLSLLWGSISLLVYIGWMLFAYIVLGKRSQEKESKRLNGIIENLTKLSQQFAE